MYVFTSTVVCSRKKESYKCDILFIFIVVILLNKNFDVEKDNLMEITIKTKNKVILYIKWP